MNHHVFALNLSNSVEAKLAPFPNFEQSAHVMELEEPGELLVHLVNDTRPIAVQAGDAAPVDTLE